MKTIEIKIQTYAQRSSIVTALAESGYKVKVVERKSGTALWTKDYFVVVDLPDECFPEDVHQ